MVTGKEFTDLTRTPEAVFGHRLLFSIAQNTSRTDCFLNALNTLFLRPAMGMSSYHQHTDPSDTGLCALCGWIQPLCLE